MKKIVSILTALIMVLPVLSQNIIQKGVTYRYNGKNPRTPIGGVYIKPISADNGVVSDASNGSFSIVLKNLTMGARIGNVKVTKQGMMVFNQMTIDEWSVRKEPLCLILCDANEFQKQKKNLIAIGEKEAKKKYERELARLKKKNETQQLQLDDYYNKLDSLENEYQNALKHMDEYADVFARIDESEIDTLAQCAVELFNKGEIEESIRVLEKGNYMNKLDNALRVKLQAQELRLLADSAETLADKDIEEYVKTIKAQIAAYRLVNDYKNEGALLKGLADRIQSVELIGDYIVFCSRQNEFLNAEQYWWKIINILDKSKDSNKKELLMIAAYAGIAELYLRTNRFDKSESMFKSSLLIYERLPNEFKQNLGSEMVYINSKLATLYLCMNRFEECEKTLKLALTIQDSLPIEQGNANEKYFVTLYKSLGDFYRKSYRFFECEKNYKSALAIQKSLANNNTTAYEPDLAISYNDLAVIYLDTHRFQECEDMYKCALTIWNRLSKVNPKAYEPLKAVSCQGLAILYFYTHNYFKSEEMYKFALDILERLSIDNPKVYKPDLASLYMNMATLYKDSNRFSECEKMYKSAIVIREKLVQDNVKAYEPDLAMSYMNLGNLYLETHRWDECEDMHKASLDIRERLAKENPQVYESELAMSYVNLGNLYKATQRFSECEKMYKSALAIRECLAKDNFKVNESDLAILYNNLGGLYMDTHRFHECEEMYKSTLVILERLSKENPKVYESDLASSYASLALLYSNTLRFAESETMYDASIKIYTQLYEENPLLYKKKLADSYYLLGFSMVDGKKYHEAIDVLEKSLELQEDIIKTDNDSLLWRSSLSCLVDLYVNEKDYKSAMEYNERLLPLLRIMFLGNAEKYKRIYSNKLVAQSYCSNCLGKFAEGEQFSLNALQCDSSNHIAYTNLAAALLFQKEFSEAEKFYLQFKSEFKNVFFDDFSEYERLKVIPKECEADVEKIKKMLFE